MTKDNTLLTSSAHMYQIAINAITFATNHGEIGDPSDLAPAAPVSMSIGKLPPLWLPEEEGRSGSSNALEAATRRGN
jgi:hypothetical protein